LVEQPHAIVDEENNQEDMKKDNDLQNAKNGNMGGSYEHVGV
jgi:hypothetical protein